MSADVDRVLKDYMSVVDHKDREHFKVLQRIQELEALLTDCRTQLLTMQSDLNDVRSERDEISTALQNLRREHEGVVSERNQFAHFTKSIRKLLVLDDAEKFQLPDVLHVLMARLEDYGAATRELQSLQQGHERFVKKSLEMIGEMELQHRRATEHLFASSDESIQAMLKASTESVHSITMSRDKSLAEGRAAVAAAEAEHAYCMTTLTPELARLRAHVDQLLRENATVTRAHDAQEQRHAVLSQVVGQLHDRLDSCVSLAADESTFLQPYAELADALVEMRGNLMGRYREFVHAAHHAFLQASSERDALAVVNGELRQQLGKTAQVASASRSKYDAERKRATKEHTELVASYQHEVTELRSRVSEGTVKEYHLSERLREYQNKVCSLTSHNHLLQEENEALQGAIAKVERSLKHRNAEIDDLKHLLSALQKSSSQVRELVDEGDAERQRLAGNVASLTQELQAVHQHLRDVSARAESAEGFARDKASVVASLERSLHDMQRQLEIEQQRCMDLRKAATDDLAAANALARQAEQRLTEESRSVTQLQEQLARANERLAAAEQNHTAAESRLELEVAQLQRQRDAERAKVVQLEAALMNASPPSSAPSSVVAWCPASGTAARQMAAVDPNVMATRCVETKKRSSEQPIRSLRFPPPRSAPVTKDDGDSKVESDSSGSGSALSSVERHGVAKKEEDEALMESDSHGPIHASLEHVSHDAIIHALAELFAKGEPRSNVDHTSNNDDPAVGAQRPPTNNAHVLEAENARLRQDLAQLQLACELSARQVAQYREQEHYNQLVRRQPLQ